jgi:hypothetical protein
MKSLEDSYRGSRLIEREKDGLVAWCPELDIAREGASNQPDPGDPSRATSIVVGYRSGKPESKIVLHSCRGRNRLEDSPLTILDFRLAGFGQLEPTPRGIERVRQARAEFFLV